jgi:hypothetical protein
MATPWRDTCPNEALPAAQRWHGNIAFCPYCQAINPAYATGNTAALIPPSSSLTAGTPAPAPAAVPNTAPAAALADPTTTAPAVPASTIPRHPAFNLPGVSKVPFGFQGAQFGPQLAPAMDFISQGASRPNPLSGKSMFVGQAMLNGANHKYSAQKAQFAPSHAGSKTISSQQIGGLTALKSQSGASQNMTERRSVKGFLVYRKVRCLTKEDWANLNLTVIEEKSAGKYLPFLFI